MKSWLLALVAVVLVTGCQPFWQSDKKAVLEDSAVVLPLGWRWESYGGIEVGVPNSWGSGTTGQPWCLNVAPGPPAPYVGRPGIVATIGCLVTKDNVPDPGSSIVRAGTFIWFSKSMDTAEKPVVVMGDRATLTLAGVELSVLAPAVMREAILDTLHTIAGGTNGCPLTHPISDDPAWRPMSADPVEGLTGVTAVSACRYGEGFLVSSVRLEGGAAKEAVANVVTASGGGGPNSPQTCAKSYAYGEEAIVLEIIASQGQGEVVMRYDGCDHHGFDDGHSVRTLTHDAVRPFFAGPNRIDSYSSALGTIMSEPAASQGSG